MGIDKKHGEAEIGFINRNGDWRAVGSKEIRFINGEWFIGNRPVAAAKAGSYVLEGNDRHVRLARAAYVRERIRKLRGEARLQSGSYTWTRMTLTRRIVDALAIYREDLGLPAWTWEQRERVTAGVRRMLGVTRTEEEYYA